ncbi:hypothetical protein RirG_195880 [Rhizophagus irregularis DAOM 197198w]|uniref:Uncharacterized protein n=1 Tax=Rhizophagus irregularis (strain DAOM 197198w) TaxID=1432141 RepID=A0A015LVP1_RHIIW|nr:hypothetical protein RirG_195880 [Rhizophagus irregularis DAOM 197198w]
MDINALELFVKHGLGMEKLLTPLYDAISEAKDQNEKRKDQEINTISEDIKIIQKMASIKLRDFERYFGKYIKQDNQDNCPSQTSMSDTDLERIRTRYPGIEDQIKKTIKIDSRNWEKMKTKYNLSCIVINKILEKTNESEENYETGETKKFAIETFYNMLTDIESDLNKLLEKYTQQSKVRRILNNVFKTSNIKKAEQMTSKESDEEFIKKLFEFELFEKKIINVSIEEYHKWKNEDFPNNLKKILPSTQNNKQLDKLKREYEEEKKIIEKNMFGQICNEIEKKYKDGGRVSSLL